MKQPGNERGEGMKIKYAWIEQIIEFESEDEYDRWADKVGSSGKGFSAWLEIDEQTGLVIARVRKQYNNNKMLDEWEEKKGGVTNGL